MSVRKQGLTGQCIMLDGALHITLNPLQESVAQKGQSQTHRDEKQGSGATVVREGLEPSTSGL